MFKINRKTEYALMVLKLMNEKCANEKTTTREVCDKFLTPFDTTAKVMQTMNQAGILSSAQGVNGGYKLNCNLNELNYLRLVELIEGKSVLMECSSDACDLHGSCNISTPVKKLNDYLSHFFEQLSIHELIKEESLLNMTISTQTDKATHGY